jgi:hypothetical protein
LEKLRNQDMGSMLVFFQRVIASSMLLVVFLAEGFLVWQPRFQGRLITLLSWYIVSTLSVHGPSFFRRRLDVCFVGFMLFATYSFAMQSGNELLVNAPVRHTSRALLSVVFMKSHVTAPLNLIQMLLTLWRLLRSDMCLDGVVPNARAQIVLGEVAALICTTSLCFLTEAWFHKLLQTEAAAKSANNAVERILCALCDAVVELDSDFCITKASPQLAHLMSPTVPLQPETLEGSLLASHLASQSDRDKFNALVSSATAPPSTGEFVKGPTSAVRVNLHHKIGREVPIEIFHVQSESPNDTSKHLAGIREVQAERIASDESCFPSIGARPTSHYMRARSSRSSHSNMSGESEVVHRQLAGLDAITLQIDDDMQIHEYALSFNKRQAEDHAAMLPTIKNCLLPNDKLDEFISWLESSFNACVYSEDHEGLNYLDRVLFRPPNAACSSSKVVLCAESVSLVAVAHDDLEEDDLFMKLRLHNISQVITQRVPTSGTNLHRLPVLSERDEDADAAT